VLVVQLARCVAGALRGEPKLMVSNRARIYENWRYALRRRHGRADYDALSRLRGAAAVRGWFVLPALCDELANDAAPPTRKGHILRAQWRAQIRATVV
jgi:hypothetical protein